MASVSRRGEPTLEYIRNRLPPIAPNDMETAIDTMIQLFNEDKILAAGKVLEQIEDGIAEEPKDSACRDAKSRIGKRGEFDTQVEELRSAYARTSEELTNLWDLGRGWIFSQELFGAKTWYKVDAANPSFVEVLSEAVFEGDMSMFVATLREYQHYKSYMPFTTGSKVLKRISRSRNVVWFHQPMPMMNRDGVMHQRLVDCMDLGFLALSMQGVNGSFPGVSIPPPKGLMIERVDTKYWDFVMEPMGRNKYLVKMVVKVDMKTALPQSMMKFMTRKMAGAALPLMHRAAMKAQNQPNKSPYPAAMAADRETWDWIQRITAARMEVAVGRHNLDPAPLPMSYAGGGSGGEAEEEGGRSSRRSSRSKRSGSRSGRKSGRSKSKSGRSKSRSGRSKSRSRRGEGGSDEEANGKFTVSLKKRVAHSNVTFYSIDVTANGTTKSVLRRYSDFVTLRDSLLGVGVQGSVAFPPKTTCSNFLAPGERTLTLRQNALSSYLREALRNKTALTSTNLREFLQLDSFEGETLNTYQP